VSAISSRPATKILVLGAAGRAGRSVTSNLLALGDFDRIFLADNDAEGLNKLIADLPGSPVSPRFLDAESERSLRERMGEADLVIGCLGPFYKHERRIVEAVIDTGRDYISLCDDSEVTAEALALNEEAESKGVTIICGCGISPGISNLLACRAASRFQSLESIELTWYLEPASLLGAGTIDHILKSFSERAPYYHHGPAKARAGSWEEYAEFPPPLGRQSVSFLAHPEPLTLPAVLRGVPEVRFKAGVGGRTKSLALQTMAWMSGNGQSELLGIILRSAARRFACTESASCLSSIKVTASGVEDGREVQKILGLVGDYYHTSALMMLVAIERWKSGRLPAGVHSPEQVLNDQAVFSRLRSLGLRFLIAASKDRASTPDRPPAAKID
jgi:lysine 6-dehydrogenase